MAGEPQGARILIVDDDPGILRAVSRILGRRHHVVTAASGEAAVEEAQQLRPDLAIVDIRMPEMTGFEVTRGLKAAQPDIDVILMTGNAEEPDDNLIQAIDEGAFYFIQKPFDRRVLLALVNRCLELRGSARSASSSSAASSASWKRRGSFSSASCRRHDGAAGRVDRRALPGLHRAGRRHLRLCRGRRRRGRPADRRRGRPRHFGGDDDRGRQGGVSGVPRRRLRAHGRGRAREGRHSRLRSRPVRDPLLCPDRPRARRADVRQRGPSRADHPQRDLTAGSARFHGPILSSALFELPCEQAIHALGPGDSLLLYTDGVTEAHGPAGIFGQDRLVSTILRGDRGAALLDGLLSEIVAFSNSPNNQDDITLLRWI